MPKPLKTQLKVVNYNEFNRVLNEVALLTDKEVGKIVRNATKDYLQGAMRATPLAQAMTNYKVITDQKGNRRIVKTEEPVKVIGRGFAKSGWIAPMIAMGMANRYAYKSAKDFSEYKGNLSGRMPFTESTNRIPYIKNLDDGDEHNRPYNIDEQGMALAYQRLTKYLNKLKEKQSQKWSKR